MRLFKLIIALSVALTMGAISAFAAVGDSFTAKTTEGVSVTYKILTVSGTTGTVQVGLGDFQHQAVPSNTTGTVTLPETVSYGGVNYSVTVLGLASFYGIRITSIIIPNTVTTIGRSAFNNCTNITSLHIPSSVTSIEPLALRNLFSIEDITVDEGNQTFDSRNDCKAIIEKESKRLVRGCINTVIPNEIEIIGDFAFSGCYMQSINLPDGLTTIGEGAFHACYYLSSIDFPNTLTSIGMNAFERCNRLSSITIPANVKTIGQYAFTHCSNLRVVTCNCTTPPTIGTDCFGNIRKYPKLFVPEGRVSVYQSWSSYFKSIVEIGDTSIYPGDTFTIENSDGVRITYMATNASTVETYGYYNSSTYETTTCLSSNDPNATISNVIVPSLVHFGEKDYTVTGLGEYSFNSTGLTSITLPSTLTYIGESAFCWNDKLAEVTCYAPTPPLLGDYVFNGISDRPVLYVPSDNIVENYLQNQDWYSVFNKIRVIGDTSFGIGDTFTAVNSQDMTITYMVTGTSTAKTYGFWDESGNVIPCFSSNDPNATITNVIIPKLAHFEEKDYTVTGIGETSFAMCEDLQSVSIPEGVESIGEGAFYYCTGLTSIVLPSTTTNIRPYAFESCSNLTAVTCMALNPPSLDEGVFDEIGSNPTLYVPDGCAAAYNNSDWYAFFGNKITELMEGKIKIAGESIADGQTYANEYGVSVTWQSTYYGTVPVITLDHANLTYDRGPAIEVSTYDQVYINLVGDNTVSSTAANSAAISIGTRNGEDAEGCYVIIGKVSDEYGNPVDFIPASLTIPATTSVGMYIHDSNIRMADFTGNIAGMQYGIYLDGVYNSSPPVRSPLDSRKKSSIQGAPLFHMVESMEMEMSGETAAFITKEWSEEAFVYYNKLLAWTPAGDTPVYSYYGEAGTFLVGNTPARHLQFGHDYFVVNTDLEGQEVPMKFRIIDEGKKTCQVFGSYENYTMIEAIPSSCQGMLFIPEAVDYNGSTYTVEQIANYAFCNSKINAIVIPESVTTIGDYAFENCYNLEAMACLPITPPAIGNRIFIADSYKKCVLYVPYGCKKKYVTDWGSNQLSYFKSVSMLGKNMPLVTISTFVANDEYISDFAQLTDDAGYALDLSDAVAAGVYYNLYTDDGEGYDTEENCIVINNTVSEETMDEIVGKGFDRETLSNQYCGIIVQVDGMGTLEIVCKTIGTGKLTVRVGDGIPMQYAQSETGMISVNFNVSEPTLIYLYSSEMAAVPDDNGENMMAKRRVNGILEETACVQIYQLSIKAPTALILADNADNSKAIDIYNEKTFTVKLCCRTLYKDGTWNTLCLPFNISTFTGTPMEGAIVMTLNSSSLDSGTLTLNFSTVTSITAGVPYLVRWEKADDYVDDNDHNLYEPVFSDVTISNELQPVKQDVIEFIGSFNPVSLAKDDKTVLYLGTGSNLYYPNAAITIGSCRAYFKLNGLTADDLPNGINNFVLNFSDEETGIGEIKDDKLKMKNGEDSWYSLDGRKLSGCPTQKGIFIYNGHKVVIK